MMTDRESWRNWTTFAELGGRQVSESEIVEELKTLPIDGVLGFLSRLSLQAVHPEMNFLDPRIQGRYLNLAIVDTFPCPLPRAASMYQPGCVPHTGDRHLFIHQRNIAWLADLAILHCRRGGDTTELVPSLQQRCCRLLLIGNDFFADPEVHPEASLVEGRSFAMTMLRNQQFKEFSSDAQEIIRALARQWLLFSKYLPRHYEVEERFSEKTGFLLADYFSVLALFVPHVFHTLARQENPWMSRTRLFDQLEEGRELAEGVLEAWITDPSQYLRLEADSRQRYPLDANSLGHFDFLALQDRPIVEARSGELIVPVLPYLAEKPANEPYFLLADDAIFRTKYGEAFEDYAHSLVERMAASASDGPWMILRGPPQQKGIEYCDSVLVQGSVAIVFEHKGGRIPSRFLRGEGGERILGPEGKILKEIDSGTIPSTHDLKKNDKALMTRGLWQLSTSSEELIAWIENETGNTINTVWPIISYQAPVTIDSTTKCSFLNPLLKAVDPFPDPRWRAPQWLHVSDLEALAYCAEDGRLDLAVLLEKKDTTVRDDSFSHFLFQEFGGFPLDPVLNEIGLNLMSEAGKRFWPTRGL